MGGENSWQIGLVCIRKKANKQYSYKVFLLFLHPGSYFQVPAFATAQYRLTSRQINSYLQIAYGHGVYQSIVFKEGM